MSKLALGLVIALTLLAQQSSVDDDSNKFYLYSTFWSGSISAGNAHTIGVQSTVNSLKPVYIRAVTVLTNVDTTITIRKGAVADPTTTAASFGSITVPSVVGMNNNVAPAFKFWPVSDIADGSLVVSYPVYASEPRTILLDGALLNTGKSTGRNFSFHFAAAAGTGQISGAVAQQK
jgi:hypothetical protein